MEKFFIIFVEHPDGGRHYRHQTFEDAKKEAERLARLPENKGKAVYVFRLVGKCKAEEMIWDFGREASSYQWSGTYANG